MLKHAPEIYQHQKKNKTSIKPRFAINMSSDNSTQPQAAQKGEGDTALDKMIASEKNSESQNII